MVVNLSKVKSEALLLFCRDLIDSYKNNKDQLFSVSSEITDFTDKQIDQLNKAINTTVQPIDYYIRNSKVSRISLILTTYNYINKNISKLLKDGDKFNPTMLCFSLLSTWFAELSIGKNEKEFLYFCLYPYSEIYDKLLLNTNNLEYKNLNISMLNIAEDTIIKLDRYRFK
ncbi:MAG: hypothetical protein U9N59_02145 [Campylobacterota bacterium]|nr:hypothetical protein [Campylobacterota bacterium]